VLAEQGMVLAAEERIALAQEQLLLQARLWPA
jgi:hypothetical protein